MADTFAQVDQVPTGKTSFKSSSSYRMLNIRFGKAKKSSILNLFPEWFRFEKQPLYGKNLTFSHPKSG